MNRLLVLAALILAAFIAVAVLLPQYAAPEFPIAPPTEETDGAPDLPVPSVTFGVCHYIGTGLQVRPDPECTPGEREPTINQGNILQTVCAAGWLDRNHPRPSTSVTNRLKYQGLIAYGEASTVESARTKAPAYEEDHFYPRELGGLTEVRIGPHGLPTNLFPERGASPNPKDGVENKLKTAMCAGRITQDEALRRISTDWTKALEGL